jgi:hypothetical protein
VKRGDLGKGNFLSKALQSRKPAALATSSLVSDQSDYPRRRGVTSRRGTGDQVLYQPG